MMRRRSARCKSSLMFSLETREQPCEVQERDCTNGCLSATTRKYLMWKSSKDSGLFEQRKLTAFQVQQLNTFVGVSFDASDNKGK